MPKPKDHPTVNLDEAILPVRKEPRTSKRTRQEIKDALQAVVDNAPDWTLIDACYSSREASDLAGGLRKRRTIDQSRFTFIAHARRHKRHGMQFGVWGRYTPQKGGQE